MKTINLLIFIVFSTFLAMGAKAASGNDHRPVTIPFADMGGIQDWRPIGTEGLLIEGHNHQWYKAEFFGPCIGLDYSLAVGFVTDPSGHVDRFSSIIVDGQRCWFKSLEKVAATEVEGLKD